MKLSSVTVATGGFSAARHVDILPEAHPCRGVHGHNFQASAYARLDDASIGFPGGQVPALHQRLADCLAPLQYRDLNTVIAQPTDENLARWIEQRIALAGIVRIAVQSTPHQGVDIDPQGIAHVWRRFEFQAAHRLPNVSIGHKCGRMHGHGFAVILHANMAAGANPISIDYDHLDRIWSPLQRELNFRCLNDIDGLDNPTSENLSAWLWRRIKPELPQLSWVSVFETRSCGANFDGSRYRIWKDFEIDSAVRLHRAPRAAPQAAIHGHSFTLRLHLQAALDELMGWTIDFGDVKEIFDPIFKAIDHRPLYEIEGLPDSDTASLADWIFRLAKTSLAALSAVELYETPGCGAILSERSDGPLLPV